jgi:surface carbohydrate biosynthesis protein
MGLGDLSLQPIVYLTCELKGRDLESRVFLAGHLLRMGFRVVLGQQWALWANQSTALRGCYFFKTANHVQAKQMEHCAQSGHLVVSCDEEALPFAGVALLDNVHPLAMERSHLFLAQNDNHKLILAGAYPAAAERIKTAGNIRVDLLDMAAQTYAAETRKIIADLGSYVLFNTGFALTNSLLGGTEGAVERLFKALSPELQNEKGMEEIKHRLAFERDSRKHIMALIDWTAALDPNLAVVVRPHPAEHGDAWQGFFKDRPNGHIVVGSNPIPWILGAQIVIHAVSTTGMEAAILGRPCLNVSPHGHEEYTSMFLMQDINYTVATAKDGAKAVVEFFQSRSGPLVQPAATAQAFAPHATQNTAQAIAKLFADHGIAPGPIPRLSWGAVERHDMERVKFTVSAAEIMASVNTLLPRTGVFSPVIEELDDSVFLLSPG